MSRPGAVSQGNLREINEIIDLVRHAHDACNAITVQRARIGPLATQAQTAGHDLARAEAKLRALLARDAAKRLDPEDALEDVPEVDLISSANDQIYDSIGQSARLRFQNGSRGRTLLMEVDGNPEALATVAISTLEVVAAGGEIAGLVLAICDARQRVLRR